jgi:adenylylsulfate kinase-like enzyme
MRAAIPWKLGYSESDRRQLALFYSQLSQEMAEQGHLVICSTVSLFKDIHKRNRKTITNYFEVWLRVPIEELRRRDTKSIYNSQGAAHASPVVGEHFIAEFPEEPDLVVDNWGPVLPRDVCDRITLAVGFPSVHLEQVLVR